MEVITVYEAINEMRRITAAGRSFSFVHATYNRDIMKCDGIREVKRARLRPAAKNDDVKYSDFKLFYYDEYFHENRVCWQMLLMYFNSKKLILS